MKKAIYKRLKRGLKRGQTGLRRILAAFLGMCIVLTGQPGIGNVLLVLASQGQDGISASESYSVCAAGESETGSIPLKRMDGSGKAFVYHSFQETKTFTPGVTYAFLNGIYEYDDAVSSLGAGAILKATNEKNDSLSYMKWRYENPQVKVYVDVVTKGKDFDHCVIGGLYEVPDSGTPTEYRYFCGYGGAQNCGPYYAYNYKKEQLGFDNVSASLKTIENQGSKNPEDYIVTVNYNGGQNKTLDPGSYTVKVSDSAPDKVTFVISDSEGNSITANFKCPLVVRYEGSGENVTDVPPIQPMWKDENCAISSQKPSRAGYEFLNWKEADAETIYTAGQNFTPEKSLWLLAQWKDVQTPEIGYTPVQVMTGTSDEDVKNEVKAALTITDNEPVDECTVEVTLSSSNFASTVGNKDVTVTVTDKAGNSTTKVCTVNVASYVDISKPVFEKDTKNLTSTLNNPGTDAITESGFVWGVMNAPSLKVNNGREKTATAVSKVNDKISVTAKNLQKGVTYYARAYIIAGGVTYYSEEITIGLGLPEYGTFTITNNGSSTFTVTRTGGSEGTQTVYYRTVNGSAVGGTHFEHDAGTLTFANGETSKTITITEKTVNTAYSGDEGDEAATAYTNADRTYFVEIYRITGGGTLGSTTSAARTMSKDENYMVDRSMFNEYKSTTPTNYATRGDYDDDKLGWTDDGKIGSNASRTVDFSAILPQQTYWQETAQELFYKFSMQAKEEEKGYQHIQLVAGSSIDTAFFPYDGSYRQKGTKTTISSLNGSGYKAFYAATFEHGGSSKDTNYATYYFPSSSGSNPSNCNIKEIIKDGAIDGNHFVIATSDLNETKITVGFGGSGDNSDKWYSNEETHYFKLEDQIEPTFLAVAPMAGGLYKVGDSFTVSLIFDEIVDSTNSSLSNVTVDTTWGTATYAGGADTNVLYFTGTVASNVSSNTLSVNRINNPTNIKDMCSCTTETATKSGQGDTKATVDTSAPNFTVTANGISNGTGTAAITVNADQAKTTGMRYAWSDTEAAPTSDWVELSSSELSTAKASGGLSLSIRKEPGSGSSGNGKWYLHVIGSYDTTGKTTYKSACVDFGTKSSPAQGGTSPTLDVTVDNTNWATERTISITAAGAAELKYRKSGVADWTTLNTNATSVTVLENGYYTFLLTAGDDITVTKTVQVEGIDTDNPTAFIGKPSEEGGGTVESPKEGVYTKLTLPVAYADAQSGVKEVQYAWTDSQTAPSSWDTFSGALSSGTAEISYPVTENTPTKKYLHLKVADNVGHTDTICSDAYTVIAQTAVDSHTPTITITGAPDKWTNDMATLTWKLGNYSGKNYEVILPDGRKAKEDTSSGEVWAMQNGTYTVTVRDLDYGGKNTASIEVSKLDFTAPFVTVSGISGDWTESSQTVTLSAEDTDSGVGEIWYKLVAADETNPDGTADGASSDGTADEENSDGTADGASSDAAADETNPDGTGKEITEDGMTLLATTESTNSGKTTVSGNITIDKDGEWYIYYRVYDNTGDTETGRTANKTEGFTEPVKIDMGEPKLTLKYGSKGVTKSEGLSVTVNVEYGVSGGKVMAGSDEIENLTANSASESGNGKIRRSAVYSVKESGEHTFTATTATGKTTQAGICVYEADFYPCSDSADTAKPVQLVASGGTLTEPEAPERTGYTFKGWYTEETDGQIWDFGTDKVNSNLKLYARWKDETPPDAPRLPDGTTLPDGWTNTQKTIPLKLYDGVGVTQLWVSVDGGEYEKINDFSGGSESEKYKYDFTGVLEGKHTYSFIAEDSAGNKSEGSDRFTIWLDTTKPEIGSLIYENKTKDFGQWIIGKTDMTITVPVMATGSSVEEISYTMMLENLNGSIDTVSTKYTDGITRVLESGSIDTVSTKTAEVKDGKAKIVFSGYFKGKIRIDCKDIAGNEADSVTIGTIGGTGGVIVEDAAPDIVITADRRTSDIDCVTQGGVALSGDYYDTVPALCITVKDDNVISAGISPASIIYKLGDLERVIPIEENSFKTEPNEEDGLQTETKFSISADDIEGKIQWDETAENRGSVSISIEAVDNAGNTSKCEVMVKVKKMEKEVQSQSVLVNSGEVKTAIIKEKGLPATKIDNLSTEAAVNMLDEKEAETVSKGETAVIYLKLVDAENTATEDEKSEIKKAAGHIGTPKIGAWLDLSLYKQIGSQAAVKIEETSGTAIEVAVELPSYLLPKDSNIVRTYTVIRYHGATAEAIDTKLEAGMLKFTTDKFSVYAIAYKESRKSTPGASSGGSSGTPSSGGSPALPGGPLPDMPQNPDQTVTPGAAEVTAPAIDLEAPSKQEKKKNGLALNKELKVSQKGRRIVVEWGEVSGADGYDVYVQYCGKKFTLKSINPAKGNDVRSITIKKVNGKKLNLKKNYKLYVLAYKLSDGKKITLGRSIAAHIVGRKNKKFTNAKEVVLKEDTYSLSKGETAAIEAKTVLVSPDKKQLSDIHAKEFRYASGNKAVASVSKNGIIRAKGEGSCIVYVYARNGYAEKIRVTVKDAS